LHMVVVWTENSKMVKLLELVDHWILEKKKPKISYFLCMNVENFKILFVITLKISTNQKIKTYSGKLLTYLWLPDNIRRCQLSISNENVTQPYFCEKLILGFIWKCKGTE
jgi:hypothetical protein